MPSNNDEMEKQETIKKLLAKLPECKMSEAKDNAFIGWVKAESERKKAAALKKKLPAFMKQPEFAAVAVSLFILAFVFNYLFTPQRPIISNIKGTVKICRAGTNEWSFVEKNNIRLKTADILKTFDDGQADIVAPHSYHLRLRNSSEIAVALLPSRISPKSIKYDLNKGRVFAYYNKGQLKKKEFRIATPEAEISVLGTDFMVSSTPMANSTWVGVLDGAVRVASVNVGDIKNIKEASVVIEPGERTVVRAGSAPSAPQRLMENELLEMEELYRIGTKPQIALLISTGKTRTRELLSGTPLYISTDASGILPKEIERIATQISDAIKSGSRQQHLDTMLEFERLVNKYPNPKYGVQFLLFIGAYYKHLGEYNKAIDIFQKVIDDYHVSNLRSIAQCAIGIIYEENLRDIPNAKLAYQKVIANYPRSPEVDEARAGFGRI
jgi:tetratricopeptide (TPR) repeat protein